MRTIEPFVNAREALTVGGLTVENRTDRVSLYGSLDLTRDRQGLVRARELRALLERVVRALERAEDLPERLPPPEPPTEVANPFR